jgi:hypothetical protein
MIFAARIGNTVKTGVNARPGAQDGNRLWVFGRAFVSRRGLTTVDQTIVSASLVVVQSTQGGGFCQW